MKRTDDPAPKAAAVIEDGLTSYNREKAGYSDTRPLAVLIREPGTGGIAGGLLGRTI